ncbi:hypothetical protein TVAG_185730 [Trichomonas vaginalis G3]|uniref:Leucine Rich Repeat family protein n=1 Tax=Trichomonas vaginalis (strain ATCC PRA-98 / G3) TaxID=412133 RepID=A2D8L7_TRIV3|nr:ribonuclease inhibitor domain-containing protein [Trichomonas vaginalis G3]EAY23266.1 hypothetical protein TVAG_185730 [Trichomonas vaginalis G3]KAI5534085.1 ribonuclease inhibitor domain-containing protein [Trichomonas vaginalis G3]|eukprot:XP_001584252.1 hypothetical protein [Trichomonas vaginalis G3]
MKSSASSIQQALTIRRRELAMTGLLNWKNVEFTDFRPLGTQKSLKVLDLENSAVTSLHTLQPQPQMTEINADNSRLATFAGLSSQPRLSKISFNNTPLAKTENCRLAALLCIGPRLSRINGVPVSKKECALAEAYPPVAQFLIESGWIVQYPPPSIHDFQYLADQFGINAKASDFVTKGVLPEESPKQPSFDFENDFSFEEVSVKQKLSNLLRPLGFAIQSGPDERNDIVRAVSLMCDAMLAIEQQADRI